MTGDDTHAHDARVGRLLASASEGFTQAQNSEEDACLQNNSGSRYPFWIVYCHLFAHADIEFEIRSITIRAPSLTEAVTKCRKPVQICSCSSTRPGQTDSPPRARIQPIRSREPGGCLGGAPRARLLCPHEIDSQNAIMQSRGT